MPSQTDRPDGRTTTELMREARAEGRIVILGTLTCGPEQGQTFLILHPRQDLEQVLKDVLDEREDIRRVAISITRAVRSIVERGLGSAPKADREAFNEDIPLLLILQLAFGPQWVAPAGVDLAIALEPGDGDIVARGGLDPELMSRAPGAVDSRPIN